MSVPSYSREYCILGILITDLISVLDSIIQVCKLVEQLFSIPFSSTGLVLRVLRHGIEISVQSVFRQSRAIRETKFRLKVFEHRIGVCGWYGDEEPAS